MKKLKLSYASCYYAQENRWGKTIRKYENGSTLSEEIRIAQIKKTLKSHARWCTNSKCNAHVLVIELLLRYSDINYTLRIPEVQAYENIIFTQ